MDAALRILSVEGWIELLNFREAAAELHDFPPHLKSSVEFIRLWVQVYAATNAWTEVEMMCETLLKHAPEDSFALFHQAEAFHRQGRTREAFAVLQYSPMSFRQGAQYFYALARYLCALGNRSLAMTCLGRAFDGDPELRVTARKDAELEPVWLDLEEG